MSTSAPNNDGRPPQISATKVEITGGTFANTDNGTIIFNNTNGNAKALEELKHHSSPDALHASEAVSRQDLCTPGTRTVTLSHLQSLATSSDPNSPDVIWMHGPAGAGKSAIMRTLADALERQGLLLGSFFFFRSESKRNTSQPFIPTLASQIWDILPQTQTPIAQAIQRNQHLFSHPARRQSPHLLEKPLLSALSSPAPPLTIIVDGLDECTTPGGQADIINAMVQLASSIRTSANRRVKVIIASRPEYDIRDTFDKMTTDPSVAHVRLDASDANIPLFYDERFDKIRKKFGLPPSWPSKREIKWLIEKTSGQYAFADVSTRFMHDGDPVARLKLIREGVKDDKRQPLEALDQLYATVFDQVPEDIRLPALRVLRCQLHPKWDKDLNVLLEPLLGLRRGQVQSLRPYLSSLIDFDKRLTPYHASLADFLADPLRSGRFSLYVDDCSLSHVIQQGVLAVFGEQDQSKHLNEREEHAFHWLFRSGRWISLLVTPYPLPRTKLTRALKKINPSSLSIPHSMALVLFGKLLQTQFQSQRLYATRPVLWYTLRYSLPHQIRVDWNRRTRLYSSANHTHIDLLFGLALAEGGTPAVSWLSINKQELPLHLDKDCFAVNSLQGWGVFQDNHYTHAYTLGYHLSTAPHVNRLWRCIQAVLQFASDCPIQERARQTMLRLIHSDHSSNPPSPTVEQLHLGSSSCEDCAKVFLEVAEALLEGSAEVIKDSPVQPRVLVTTYHIARESEICWGNAALVLALANSTARCLNMPRFQYLPNFLVRSQKRVLEEIFQALMSRCDELETPTESDIVHEKLLHFIGSQLRSHEDLVFLFVVICSFIVCLFAVYIML